MSPVSTDDVREGAFEALLQAVAAQAGSFQAEHPALGEDFPGYRIRVRGQALAARESLVDAGTVVFQDRQRTPAPWTRAAAWVSCC